MKLVTLTRKSLLVGGLLAGACSGSDDADAAAQAKDTAPSTPVATLFINELQPSNQDTITDEFGDADDWIEIYNGGDTAEDMQSYAFSDSSGVAQTIMGSVVVQPHAFQLFWADGSPGQGHTHLGFKLSATAGDKVTLKDALGRTVDTVVFGPANGQSTYGRFPDSTGAFAWCGSPTPGVSNGTACAAP